MPRLYLIRHGEAAASWDQSSDPGLSALGQTQARAMAAQMAPLGPLSLISSPLARARETAVPLEELWGVSARIEPRVAEIPSPGIAFSQRRAWLTQLMQGTWSQTADDLQAWRAGVISTLLALPSATAITSHFIAINAAVGAVLGRDDVVVFQPGNASVTILDSDGQSLRLVRLGEQSQTKVN